MERKVLVIDEGTGEGESLAAALRLAGFGAEGTRPNAGAIHQASAMAPDLLILVIDDGQSDAIGVGTTIAWVHGIPVIVLVDRPVEGLARRLTTVPHVRDVLRRPVPRPWLMRAIERALTASPVPTH